MKFAVHATCGSLSVSPTKLELCGSRPVHRKMKKTYQVADLSTPRLLKVACAHYSDQQPQNRAPAVQAVCEMSPTFKTSVIGRQTKVESLVWCVVVAVLWGKRAAHSNRQHAVCDAKTVFRDPHFLETSQSEERPTGVMMQHIFFFLLFLNSCEIEDFVETNLCKLRINYTSIARSTGFICMTS